MLNISHPIGASVIHLVARIGEREARKRSIIGLLFIVSQQPGLYILYYMKNIIHLMS